MKNGKGVKSPFSDRKEAVRTELIRRASKERTITYSELGRTVGLPTNGYWKPLLDEISREETAKGLPDVTFLVVSWEQGLSSQIGFRAAKPAAVDQEKLAVESIRACFDHYGRARRKSKS